LIQEFLKVIEDNRESSLKQYRISNSGSSGHYGEFVAYQNMAVQLKKLIDENFPKVEEQAKCEDGASFMVYMNNYEFETAKQVLIDKFSFEDLIDMEIFLKNSLEAVRTVIIEKRREENYVNSGSS